MGICVENYPKTDGLLFYLPTSKKLMGSADYCLDPTVPYGPVFGYHLMEVLVSTYIIPPPMTPARRPMKKNN